MDPQELKITAAMAMLELDESGVAALAGAVDQMLEYFTTMAAIDVKNVEPTTQILAASNRLRPDGAHNNNPANLADAVLEQAPDLEDRLIAIPNVL
ncbi:aspartyl/glutamyl-tRNA(Asn/Gln) amidotransferase subunit C [Alkalispirochaeta americana]|uniref:Glutamyl-tRNA(Gln) amidotransferase subunit C n=2 Tax=Alkalispirochaeta americana TaxID=159291 RepID=A0A1N6QB07_9SPIO|nr:aspartyl/glutamyl-tRNA(Asn/Gln) amidotransferase subunit C [Alkalispirochaeta americana]